MSVICVRESRNSFCGQCPSRKARKARRREPRSSRSQRCCGKNRYGHWRAPPPPMLTGFANFNPATEKRHTPTCQISCVGTGTRDGRHLNARQRATWCASRTTTSSAWESTQQKIDARRGRAHGSSGQRTLRFSKETPTGSSWHCCASCQPRAS